MPALEAPDPAAGPVLEGVEVDDEEGDDDEEVEDEAEEDDVESEAAVLDFPSVEALVPAFDSCSLAFFLASDG